jgi:hypothetical protein
MIDSEIKSKIIALHEQGNSNSFISKTIKVSLPTIRKIINDVKDEPHKNSDNIIDQNEEKHKTIENKETSSTPKPSEPRETILASELTPTDEFIVNLSQFWLTKSESPYLHLKNGAWYKDLPIHLRNLYPAKPEIVDEIIRQIYASGYMQQIFKVTVTHEKAGPTIYVRPLKVIHNKE